MRILLIEDDELLGDSVKMGLRHYGYSVDWIKDSDAAQSALRSKEFDVVALNLGSPELSSLSLLQEFRSAGNSTPIIILTAHESDEDIQKALESGADDYLTKPFGIDELTARMRALKRRRPKGGGDNR